MSHEGIRIINLDDARREQQAEQPLSPDAITPAKVKVDITGGTGLAIDWKDGHHSAWTFAFLRDACPCATCHESREADGREPGVPKPQPVQIFPIYTAPARPLTAEPIGRYAIKFKWNDGHESGIYAWEFLRRLDETTQ